MFLTWVRKWWWMRQGKIVIVSGLPRSGTSMMMKMLEVGGLPPLTDYLRVPDEDNPKGYYEFERVKGLDKGDVAWLPGARNKAVKVISALLKYLPDDYTYELLFMRRKLEEVLASQRQMLVRRGHPVDQVDDEKLAALFQEHLYYVERWIRSRPNVRWLNVDYNAMLVDPFPQVRRINRFLGGWLNEHKMIDVIDPNLYRQRR